MGFVGFLLIFFIGVFIASFFSKKTIVFMITAILSSVVFYFFAPMDTSEQMDEFAMNFDGGPESFIYKTIETFKEAFKEIDEERVKALNMDALDEIDNEEDVEKEEKRELQRDK